MVLRRIRGLVIRLARRRPAAIAVGIALAAPGVWLEFSGRADRWWLDGISLISAATGIALILAGAAGVGPDWVEPPS